MSEAFWRRRGGDDGPIIYRSAQKNGATGGAGTRDAELRVQAPLKISYLLMSSSIVNILKNARANREEKPKFSRFLRIILRYEMICSHVAVKPPSPPGSSTVSLRLPRGKYGHRI